MCKGIAQVSSVFMTLTFIVSVWGLYTVSCILNIDCEMIEERQKRCRGLDHDLYRTSI